MATGDDKKAAKQQDKANKALQPKSYSDPFGSLKNGNFTPNVTPGMQAGINNFDQSIGDLSGQIPKSFSVNDYYNNPFYETTSDLYKAPIQRQYQQDKSSLDNNLNARNQLGGSYDALRNQNLDQQRDFQLNQADDQARLSSANAYQTQYSNLMNSLQGALSGRSSLLEQIYAPAKLALGYQNAVAPLQGAQANVYNTAQQAYLSRPTNTQNTLSYLNTGANGARAAMSGGAI